MILLATDITVYMVLYMDIRDCRWAYWKNI